MKGVIEGIFMIYGYGYDDTDIKIRKFYKKKEIWYDRDTIKKIKFY